MLPYLTSKINKNMKSITVFDGLNSSPYKNENELVSCVNTSGKYYPFLSVRNQRKTHIETCDTITGASFYNGLFYTSIDEETGKNYICHTQNKTELPQTDITDKRFFSGISDNILIMPDKVLYNVSSNTAKKLTDSQSFDMDKALEKAREELPGISTPIPNGVARLTSDLISFTRIEYGVHHCYCVNPENINEGDFVYISMDVDVQKVSDTKKYEQFKSDMKKGMFVQISEIHQSPDDIYSEESYRTYAIRFEKTPIDTKDFEDIYITSLTMEKRIPDFIDICSYGNRVWGVEKNTIRCSLLGDPAIWYDFSADTFGTLPSSCYSVDVDTGGDFTAICQYNGNIIAFKENCIHKISGNQPENFTLYTQSMKGVKKGANNTLKEIGGILYYMSNDGFYAYSGGYPICISDKLPMDTDGISAGTDGKNYYVLANIKGKRQILVYYPDCKIWHIEDAEDEFSFAKDINKLYIIGKHKLTDITHSQSGDDTNFKFSFSFDENTHFNKNYTRLLLKYSMKKGGYFKVTAVCDNNPVLCHIYGEFNHGENMESIITLPRIRCRNLLVTFEGKGDFILKSLLREYFLLKEGGK